MSAGPEADERAEARKRITEAEIARLAAADHVGRLTGTAKASRWPAATGATVLSEPAATPASAPLAPHRHRRTRHPLLGRR